MLRLGISVSTTAALAVALAPAAAADTLGTHCTDWMRVSTDASTGAKMFCAAGPGSDEDALAWTDWSQGAWGDAPTVGPVGSACRGSVPPFGLSSDGYVVWCRADGTVLLPGADEYVPADSSQVWSIYSP